jgi:hypothetical protein
MKAIDGVNFSGQKGTAIADATAATDVPSYQQLVDLGIPPGGATDQVLAKASNLDYDTVWAPPATGGGGAYTGGNGIAIDNVGMVITAVGDVARGIAVDALGIHAMIDPAGGLSVGPGGIGIAYPIHLPPEATDPTPPADGVVFYPDGNGDLWYMTPDGVVHPVGGMSWPLLDASMADTEDLEYGTRVTGDAFDRFQMTTGGHMSWGEGWAAPGADSFGLQIWMEGGFSHATTFGNLRMDDDIGLWFIGPGAGVTLPGLLINSTITDGTIPGREQGPRLYVERDGRFQWGDGVLASTQLDTALWRASAGVLKIKNAIELPLMTAPPPTPPADGGTIFWDDPDGLSVMLPDGSTQPVGGAALTWPLLDASMAAATDLEYGTRVTGDAFNRYEKTTDGTMRWGDGASAPGTAFQSSMAWDPTLYAVAVTNGFAVKGLPFITVMCEDDTLGPGTSQAVFGFRFNNATATDIRDRFDIRWDGTLNWSVDGQAASDQHIGISDVTGLTPGAIMMGRNTPNTHVLRVVGPEALDNVTTVPAGYADGTVLYAIADELHAITSDGVDYTLAPAGAASLKYSADCPAGATWAVAHALGSTDVVFSIKDVATSELVSVGAVVTDANTLTITFPVAATAAQYRVTVLA